MHKDEPIDPPLIPGNRHIAILGAQRVVQIVEPILREKLFAPLGLFPEPVPVHVDLRMNVAGRALGETRFRAPSYRPIEIALVDPSEGMIEDKRPGGGRFLPTFDFVGVIAHELVHASIWRNVEENMAHDGHGPTFEKYMREIGLVDPNIKGGHSGPKFRDWYVANILPQLDAAVRFEVGDELVAA